LQRGSGNRCVRGGAAKEAQIGPFRLEVVFHPPSIFREIKRQVVERREASGEFRGRFAEFGHEPLRRQRHSAPGGACEISIPHVRNKAQVAQFYKGFGGFLQF
jgi:hypothetical protein